MKGKSNFQKKGVFSLSKLKLFLLGMLVVFFLGSLPGYIYSQDDVYLSFSREKNENYHSTLPLLTLKDSGNSGVTIHYKFKGAVLSPRDVEGATYYIPHIYGFSHMNEVGSPRLPAKNLHIAIRSGSQVQVELIDIQFKEYPQKFRIHPALALAPDCRGCPEPEFVINRGVYELDADFPREPVEILGVDTYMGAPIAVIQVRPLQVNPVTGTIKAYTRLKFKVTFIGGKRSFDSFAANSEHTNRMIKSAVLNRGAIPRGTAPTGINEQTRDGRKDYIMIVHSNYLAAAEALATWKRQMGYSVEIVSQSSWTTTQVKDALQSRYDSWTPKPLFFLLFGDQADVPAEYTGYRYTDLYYAEMEGSGYKPEMAYGRIFPSSASNAQVIVNKIINYEKTPPTLSGFYNNALACAYFQDDERDGYATRRFAHTSEDLRNHVMGQGYGVNRVYVTESSVDPMYYNNGYFSPANTPIPTELRRPTFAWDGDYNDIIGYINAGRFLVWHRDHGGVTLWGDPYFTTTHINQLNNGSLLPVVLSVNCLTGQFTSSSECFCERFLRKDSGGCVGIFGATNVSYSGPNDGYAPGLIDAVWPVPQIDPQYGSGGLGNPIPAHDPIYTMGDILNHSKMAMEYLWGTSQTTWELHHYYGDPAMKIRTAVPTTATASHPSSLPVGATSLDITSSNCGGGIAALVYEDTLVGKTTLAGNGTGTITFAPLSGSEPTAILTISKHNYKPYIANINITATSFNAQDLVVRSSDARLWLRPFENGIFGASKRVGHGWNFTDYFVGHWNNDDDTHDLIVRNSSGELWLYPYRNETFYTYGCMRVGQNFNYTHYFVGNWTDNGTDDLIVRNSSGYLWLFPYVENVGFGTGISLGGGWNYTHYFVGNWSGNGTPDLVCRDASGYMWYYRFENGAFASRKKVGNGWNFTHYFVGNWTGDGTDDLIVRDSSGRMRLYPFRNESFYYVPGAGAIVATGWNFTLYLVGDWDNNDTDDMIVRDSSGNLILYPFENNTFGTGTTAGTSFNYTHYLVGQWTDD